ncbi:DUSP26 [Symbiodinium natans]|uniref:DUSP26 protein n=1 Tax=Symbiodinium natans TaxID=878477 RepID=A0A812JFS1_9DINO|nr:DUSP26 [Symbiodinium natans]
MVHLIFEGLPECVRSGWPFILHVVTSTDGEQPDRAYEGYLKMELVLGGGRLRGELTELASGGQADFLSLSYEGQGPFRLRVAAETGEEVTSEPVMVEPAAAKHIRMQAADTKVVATAPPGWPRSPPKTSWLHSERWEVLHWRTACVNLKKSWSKKVRLPWKQRK